MDVNPWDMARHNYPSGARVRGKVRNLTSYGAFIELEEGVEGLIHNSELSWTNKNIQPSKVLSASQKISVKIVNIDIDAKRISLSYKETLENPWSDLKDSINKEVTVKIKNVTDKAIFAELNNGLTGMLHYCLLYTSPSPRD